MLKLDINLLWTVVNVLIMYALLRKFLFKPVQDVLDKRQKMVDDELANAQDAKTKAEAALAAANDKLHNVDVEAAARRHDRRGRHRDLRSRRRCGRQGHGSGRLRRDRYL